MATKTTGAKAPTAAQTIAEGNWADDTWVNPQNIYGAGETSVTATSFDAGDQTYILKAYTFDFSAIPDTATIRGVTCVVNARYATALASIDCLQLLDTSRARVGDNLCATPQALTTTASNYTFGSSTNLWGNALTPAWVKDADFGVGIGCLAGGTGNNNVDVYIDSVTLEVTYEYVLNGEVQTYTLTGNDAGLIKAYRLDVEKGSFALTGNPAVVSKNPIVTLDSPTDYEGITDSTPEFLFTGTGETALQYQIQISTTPDFVGGDVILDKNSVDNTAEFTGTFPSGSGDQVAYTVPSASALTAGEYYWRVRARDIYGSWGPWASFYTFTLTLKNITAEKGAFTFTGNDTILKADRKLNADAQSYTLVGNDVTLVRPYRLDCEVGNFALAGGISATNFISNPTMIDSNSDGLADDWEECYGTETTSIVTGNGFTGNAQRVVATVGGTAQAIQPTGFSFTQGHIYKIRFKYRSSGNVPVFEGVTHYFDILGANTGNAVQIEMCVQSYLVTQPLRFFIQNIDEWIEISDVEVTEMQSFGDNIITPSAASNFETDGTATWDSVVRFTKSWDSTEKAMKLVSTDETYGWNIVGINNGTQATTSYRLTFRAKATASMGKPAVSFGLDYLNTYGANLTSSWQNYSYAFRTTSGYHNLIIGVAYPPIGSELFIDDVICQEASDSTGGTLFKVDRKLDAEAGSFAFTGNDVSLEAIRSYSLDAECQAYILTGNDSALSKTGIYSMDAEAQSYSLTGQDASLTKQTLLLADKQTYTFTGNDAGVFAGRKLNTDFQVYTLDGKDVSITKGYKFTAEAVSFSLSGNDSSLLAQHLLSAESQSYIFTGLNAVLTKIGSYALDADPQSYSVTGNDVSLLAQHTLSADKQTYDLTGNDVIFTYTPNELNNYTMAAEHTKGYLPLYDANGEPVLDVNGDQIYVLGDRTFNVVGHNAELIGELLSHYSLDADKQSYILTGNDVQFRYYSMSTETGVFGLAGNPVNFDSNKSIDGEKTSYTFSGNDVTFLTNRVLQAEQGSFVLSGKDVVTGRGLFLSVEAQNYLLSGKDAAFEIRRGIIATKQTYLVTGKDVDLIYYGLNTNFFVEPGVFGVSGNNVIMELPTLIYYRLNGQWIELDNLKGILTGGGSTPTTDLILTAPNSSRWRVTVGNDGALTTTEI